MPSSNTRRRLDLRIRYERLGHHVALAELPALNPPIVAEDKHRLAAESGHEVSNLASEVDRYRTRRMNKVRGLVGGIVEACREGEESAARATTDESGGGGRRDEKGGVAEIGELGLLKDLLL